MRGSLVGLALIAGCSSTPPSTPAPAPAAKVSITGHVVLRTIDRGPGCKPTDRGPVDARGVPWPIWRHSRPANESLAVRRGNRNSETPFVGTIVTGSNGVFTLTVDAPGEYCVLDDDFRRKPRPTATTVPGKIASDVWTDYDCLRTSWDGCEAVIAAPSTGAEVVIERTSDSGLGCYGECENGPTIP